MFFRVTLIHFALAAIVASGDVVPLLSQSTSEALIGQDLLNYQDLQQRNAELTLQLEALTQQAQHLQHEKSVTRLRTRLELSKVTRGCLATRGGGPGQAVMASPPSPPPLEGLRGSALPDHLPWSLVHTKTNREQRVGQSSSRQEARWFPGMETMTRLFDEVRKPLNFHSDTEHSLEADVGELNAQILDTRKRLASTQKESLDLENHVEVLQAKVARQNAAAEAASEARLKIDQEANKASEVDKRLKESSEKLREAQVAEKKEFLEQITLQNSLDDVKRRVLNDESQLANVEQDNAAIRSSRTAEEQNIEAVSLSNRTEVEIRSKSFNSRLMGEAAQHERCMLWAGKLEEKLEKVLNTKKEDSSLCSGSILSLHKERITARRANVKLHAELKHLKQRTSELERQSSEAFDTLNGCLSGA